MAHKTSGFKLSYQTKRIMSTFTDPHEEGEFKRLMIIAELAALSARQKSKFNRKDSEINDTSPV
jgi:hypothetical protein